MDMASENWERKLASFYTWSEGPSDMLELTTHISWAGSTAHSVDTEYPRIALERWYTRG